MMKNLEYYKALPYERQWSREEVNGEECYLVRIAEFPRIYGAGKTMSEALDDLRATFDDMVSWAVEDGVELPEPRRPLAPTRQKAIELTPKQKNPTADTVRLPEGRAGTEGVTGQEYEFDAGLLRVA